MDLKELIEEAWENRSRLEEKEVQIAIKTIISDLDTGSRRVAEPDGDGWKVNEWIKKAVILYFPLRKMQLILAHMWMRAPWSTPGRLLAVVRR